MHDTIRNGFVWASFYSLPWTQVAIFYQVRSLLNGLCLLDDDNLVSSYVW
jgi:hypothetical protein